MEATSQISEAAALLERLSPADVEKRLTEIRAEDRALRTLLRTLRARESAANRKLLREGRSNA